MAPSPQETSTIFSWTGSLEKAKFAKGNPAAVDREFKKEDLERLLDYYNDSIALVQDSPANYWLRDEKRRNAPKPEFGHLKIDGKDQIRATFDGGLVLVFNPEPLSVVGAINTQIQTIEVSQAWVKINEEEWLDLVSLQQDQKFPTYFSLAEADSTRMKVKEKDYVVIGLKQKGEDGKRVWDVERTVLELLHEYGHVLTYVSLIKKSKAEGRHGLEDVEDERAAHAWVLMMIRQIQKKAGKNGFFDATRVKEWIEQMLATYDYDETQFLRLSRDGERGRERIKEGAVSNRNRRRARRLQES